MKVTNPHELPETLQLENVLETSIGKVFIYKNIVIVEATEGVTINYKTAFSILVKGLKLLGTRPWIYIANRVNSYSVQPTDYKYLEKVPTLKGIAIVCYSSQARENAELERKFYKNPLDVFDSINEAYLWGKEILEGKIT